MGRFRILKSFCTCSKLRMFVLLIPGEGALSSDVVSGVVFRRIGVSILSGTSNDDRLNDEDEGTREDILQR